MVFISFIYSVSSNKNLKESLESIFSQSFGDFEVFCIVETCCGDIKEILGGYAAEKRFEVIEVSQDSSLSSLKNRGIERASGKYISFLTNENVLMRNDILEEIKEFINGNPSKIFSCNAKMEGMTNLHNNPYVSDSCPFYENVSKIKTEEYETPLYLSNNIFDRNYLIENALKFRDLSQQDVVFLIEALTCNEYYLTIPKFFSTMNIDIPEDVTVSTYVGYLQAFNVMADILSSADGFEGLLERIEENLMDIKQVKLPIFTYREFKLFEVDIKRLMNFLTRNQTFFFRLKRTFRYVHNRIYNRVNDFDVMVSIIIPTYNVEYYLDECLVSLLNQTYENFEIIIVDDSSTDSTVDIIEFYERLDPRIRYVEKKRKSGSGGSRNHAMEIARGKYVQFVDSDDWIELNALETLVEYAEKYELDMLMFKTILYSEAEKDFFKKDYFSISTLDDFNYRIFNLDDVSDKLFTISVTPINKLYSRIFLKTIGATFPENHVHQDNPYFYQVFCESERVYLIDEYFYNYRNRDDSISYLYDDTQLGTIEIVEYILNVFIDNTLYDGLKRGILNLLVYKLRNRSTQVSEEFREEYYLRTKNKLLKFNIEYGLESDLRENLYSENLQYFEAILSSRNYENFLEMMDGEKGD